MVADRLGFGQAFGAGALSEPRTRTRENRPNREQHRESPEPAPAPQRISQNQAHHRIQSAKPVRLKHGLERRLPNENDMRIPFSAVFVLAWASGCSPDSSREAAAGRETMADSAAPAPDATGHGTALVPANGTLETVTALAQDPGRQLPPDSADASHEQIRLGLRIVRETKTYAGAYVGNEMTCGNCHLNAGQKDGALPFVGISGTFPHFRSRSGRLISLEDRIRDCFVRSMNGSAPPYDSKELLAVSAYITWLSRGQPVGKDPPWRGRNTIAKKNQIPIDQLDVAHGQQLYLRHCAMCHGPDGQGVELKTAKAGPLWGPGSWNDGAGAARVYTLAGYIRYAMPLTSPGSLSDQEAQHIAAFISAHERPSFPAKATDYPDGDIPVDAVYYPQRFKVNPLMAKLATAASSKR